MLVQLHIQDLAIIEEVDLTLGSGLNVLTGETGAGKSIIVGAAGLLRGGRASSDMVRSGSEQAVVEALFDIHGREEVARLLEESGLPVEGEELVIRRTVPRSGRSRIYVNGAICTAAMLSNITGHLLDISGQHEHQILSESATQRRILDALGLSPEELERMDGAYSRVRLAADRLARSQMNEQQRSNRLDFVAFQVKELEAAKLQPGEEEELERQRARLMRAGELMEMAVLAEQALYSSEDSVADRLARLKQRLVTLLDADPDLEPLAGQIEEARALVEDVALSLGRYGSGVEADPSRLEEVEARLDLLYRLKRKHGATVEEILERLAAMRQELVELESHDERVAGLKAELRASREEAEQVAARLSAARRKAARRLSRSVTRELQSLRMNGAKLVVEVSPQAPREGDAPDLCFGGHRLGAVGWDRVEFRICANVGEEVRPLRLVASGGELSRIMLALRKELGNHDPVSTSIYDEVDAGIGGAVADVAGRFLSQVSRHRQVLCVTHLPQIAAYADHHFRVGKEATGGRTCTTVVQLDRRERIEELARMLGGERVTSQARANARQLLQAAIARH